MPAAALARRLMTQAVLVFTQPGPKPVIRRFLAHASGEACLAATMVQ